MVTFFNIKTLHIKQCKFYLIESEIVFFNKTKGKLLMKKFNHSQILQSTLVLAFLFITTISFGQKVSLKPSGGSEPNGPYSSSIIRICAGNTSTASFYFYNNTSYTVTQAFVNTNLNANISTSQPQNTTLNPGASLYVDIEVSKYQSAGSFNVSLTYFDPVLSQYCIAHMSVSVEKCEEPAANIPFNPNEN